MFLQGFCLAVGSRGSLTDQIRFCHTVRTVQFLAVSSILVEQVVIVAAKQSITAPCASRANFLILPRQLIRAGQRADFRYFRNMMQPHFSATERHCRPQLGRPLAPQRQLHRAAFNSALLQSISLACTYCTSDRTKIPGLRYLQGRGEEDVGPKVRQSVLSFRFLDDLATNYLPAMARS